MSDPTSEILDPDQPLTLSTGATVVVREMTWKQSKRFLTALASRAAEFTTLSADGRAEVNTERLVGVIATDLGEALIVATTDLDAAGIEALRLRDVMVLLDHAVALNLKPEMIEAGKAVAGRFKTLIKKG